MAVFLCLRVTYVKRIFENLKLRFVPQLLLYFLPPLFAFILTFAVARLLCMPRFAKYFNDKTGGKKLHIKATPASGGIAVFTGLFTAALIFDGSYLVQNYIFILLGFVAMFLLGLVDDLHPLGWRSKLMLQFAIISFIVLMGDLRLESVMLEHSFYRMPYYLSTGISILLILFLTNAFNFIDGVDGLATTVALLFFLGLLFFQTPFSGVFLMCGAAALFAFRRFNIEPAQLFMGDSGSLFLGLMCAVFCILFLEADLSTANVRLQSYQQRLPVMTTLFWYPVFDTVRVLFLRLYKRKSLFKRDKRHSYSVLLRVGYTHTQIVTLVFVLTGIQLAGVLLLEPVIGLLIFLILQILLWIGLHVYLNFQIKNFKKNSN